MIVWGLGLLLVQFILEPNGTIQYFGFLNVGQVGEVYSLSLYGFSPVLWAIFVPAGAIAAVLLARSRFGWAAAVVYSTIVTPRLLVYQMMGLVAAVRPPEKDQPQGATTGTPAAAGSQQAASTE